MRNIYVYKEHKKGTHVENLGAAALGKARVYFQNRFSQEVEEFFIYIKLCETRSVIGLVQLTTTN